MTLQEQEATIKWLKQKLNLGGVQVNYVDIPLHELIQWVINHQASK